MKMIRNWIAGLMFLIAGVFSAFGCSRSPEPRLSVSPSWQKGMTFTHAMAAGRGYGSAASRAMLKELKKLNVEWVAVIPYCYQPDSTRAHIIFMNFSDPRCATEDEIRATIRDAHAQGFKVMLKPHVWVGKSGRRDGIRLHNDRERDRWFAQYQRLITSYARLAQEESVELLCVGVELDQLTLPYPDRWRQTIQEVRQWYRGPLTYAAHWRIEFEKLQFWDMLDYMGLNYYIPAPVNNPTTITQLIEATEENCREVERIQRRWNRPILVTEVGFKSTPDCAGRPWEWPQPQTKINLILQAQCYHAIFHVFSRKSWCAGLYWWHWSTDSADGGTADPGFTPRGKPAETVLRIWYAAPR